MSNSNKIDINHLAKLSNLVVDQDQSQKLASQLEDSLETISVLDELNTKDIEPTSQVTGLTNVFREDEVNYQTTFSQEQALKNATNPTYKGYFVVPAVINNQS